MFSALPSSCFESEVWETKAPNLISQSRYSGWSSFLTLIMTIIYQMNVMVYLIWHWNSDWVCKAIREAFSEVSEWGKDWLSWAGASSCYKICAMTSMNHWYKAVQSHAFMYFDPNFNPTVYMWQQKSRPIRAGKIFPVFSCLILASPCDCSLSFLLSGDRSGCSAASRFHVLFVQRCTLVNVGYSSYPLHFSSDVWHQQTILTQRTASPLTSSWTKIPNIVAMTFRTIWQSS